LFVLLVFSFWSSLYVLDVNPFTRWIAGKNFLRFYRLFLDSGNCFLFHAQTFKLGAILFATFYSYFLSIRVLVRKVLPMPISLGVFPTFSSSCFRVSSFH
jgi:hypothetical protein